MWGCNQVKTFGCFTQQALALVKEVESPAVRMKTPPIPPLEKVAVVASEMARLVDFVVS